MGAILVGMEAAQPSESAAVECLRSLLAMDAGDRVFNRDPWAEARRIVAAHETGKRHDPLVSRNVRNVSFSTRFGHQGFDRMLEAQGAEGFELRRIATVDEYRHVAVFVAEGLSAGASEEAPRETAPPSATPHAVEQSGR